MVKKKSGQLNVLFVCNLNMMRSPTAEEIFREHPALNVKSAGISRSAVVPICRELLEWADIVFVMEKKQQVTIENDFKDIRNFQIYSLNISDSYDYMDPALKKIIKKRVEPYLSRLFS